ncbi:class I SAM-dependent methyltransferase [Streptomyces coerulescens]|uniref:Class I SAM-dependent methyltransferase n=1 Tax=Streptomyces coerulescens TaxID=29304 RepID=A0ABW0CYC3_STRCD
MISTGKETARLSAADWNRWAATVHPDDLSAMEADHFQQMASPMPGMTAVDLACGTGLWTRQLAAWGMTVTGYDFSDEALRRAKAAGSGARLSYRLWDIVADPIPPTLVPGQLDVVTCRYGLPYLEPGRLLTDVGRWLKPSGVFYAVVHVEADAEPGAIQCRAPGNQPSAATPFAPGLQEEHLSEVGAGWAKREVHQLGPCRRAIVLHGYGLAPWEWSRVMDESLAPAVGLTAAHTGHHRIAEGDAS